MQVKTVFVGNKIILAASGFLVLSSTSAPLAVTPAWTVDLPAVVSITPTSGTTCNCTALTPGIAVVTCTSGILPIQQVQFNVVDPLMPADVLNVTIT